MPNLKDLMEQPTLPLYTMFTGEVGTWKSTMALSFPRPQYWFFYDQKPRSLIIPMKNWGINPEEVDYDNYPDFNKALAKLETFLLNPKNKKGEKYKTIITDSISMQADAINFQTLRLKSGTTNKDGKEAGMRIAGIPVNTLEDYKAEASGFTQWIAKMKDLQEFHKCNIILIAHVAGEAKENSSRIIITGGKSISGKLPAVCEEVYHFYTKPNMDSSKEAERYVSTIHTGSDFARTTLPLPARIKLEANKPLYSSYIEPALKELVKV